MGRITTPLSDAQIRRAKAGEKRYKLSDGGGLYLFVHPSGRKVWRVRYRVDGRSREIVVGEYPAVSLSDARRRAVDVRQAVRDGVDPVSLYDGSRVEQKRRSFDAVASEFFALKEREWSTSHLFAQIRRYEIYVKPEIGDVPVDEVSKRDVVRIVESARMKRTLSSRQTERVETARKVFFVTAQILRYALNVDEIENDPSASIDISQILPKVEKRRLKAITDHAGVRAAFSQLLEYEGTVTRLALEFLALSALRPGNVRNMRWEWVCDEDRVVVFPKDAMKGRVEFRLPLTQRMLEIVDEMRMYTSESQFVFCSPIAPSKQMSENTLNFAHKRLGIENHNAHGWRSSFSTICYERQREHGFGYEVIESQLSHRVGSDVKLAYLRSDFLDDRMELLEWWYTFLRS